MIVLPSATPPHEANDCKSYEKESLLLTVLVSLLFAMSVDFAEAWKPISCPLKNTKHHCYDQSRFKFAQVAARATKNKNNFQNCINPTDLNMIPKTQSDRLIVNSTLLPPFAIKSWASLCFKSDAAVAPIFWITSPISNPHLDATLPGLICTQATIKP